MQITKNIDTSNGKSTTQSVEPHKQINFKNDQIIRLLIQSLYSLGYHDVAKMLEQDSGILFENSTVTEFREAILKGHWSKSELLLSKLCILNKQKDQLYDQALNQGRFLIRQQKFLELLEAREVMKALGVLRNELSPLGENTERLHELSSLILCSSADEVKQIMNWDGANSKSRYRLLDELQGYIDPSMMIPRDRLITLINQAYQWQVSKCSYHDKSSTNFSLFVDHICDRNQLPTKTISILKGHTDEVWHISFSHCGRYLASCSKDFSCIIWDMQTFQRIKVLSCPSQITFSAWSPDDSKLAICGLEKLLLIWDPKKGELLQSLVGHTEQVTSCAWLQNNTHIISGSFDRTLKLWKIDSGEGELLQQWNDIRVVDMSLNSTANRLVVTGYDQKIMVYDVSGLMITKISEIQEQSELRALTLSNDGRYALISLPRYNKLHLWDLDEQIVIKRYENLEQAEFVIRSTFGGNDNSETYVISGSDDNAIYIWNKEQETLLEVLQGHQGTVNSVVWCPKPNSRMFASASDDKTIRIWGIEEDLTTNDVKQNGNHVHL